TAPSSGSRRSSSDHETPRGIPSLLHVQRAMTHQQAVDGMASERYLLDEMSEVERFEFEAHYFDCAECAEDGRLADMLRDEAKRGVARPAARVSPFPGHRSAKREGGWRRPMVAAPWAAAAALALMVSYQSFITVPALRNSIASESL